MKIARETEKDTEEKIEKFERIERTIGKWIPFDFVRETGRGYWSDG